ncbi:unnamed protein product [Angiostrongylus costaricensis]|uniref:Uncharacterized protein n=1 Tax=Angiostrongylus costaricensis TaxID=334426 RepID=A0A0R3PGM3_ANGCS|nr:unnamed protein product [Angiostrongylus costaricensis]
MNIDSFEQLTTGSGRLRLDWSRISTALTILVVYAPTSNYSEEEEAFCINLKKFYREDRTLFQVIVVDFNAKIEPRRTSEKRHMGTHELEWNELGEQLSEFIMMTKIIHGNSQF